MERTLLAASNFTPNERSILTRAVRLLEKKLRAEIVVLNSPQLVRQWLALKFAGLDREVFAGIFLDAQNRLLAFDGALYGHVDPSFRLSTRGRQGGTGKKRRGSDVRSQPPVWMRGAVAR